MSPTKGSQPMGVPKVFVLFFTFINMATLWLPGSSIYLIQSSTVDALQHGDTMPSRSNAVVDQQATAKVSWPLLGASGRQEGHVNHGTDSTNSQRESPSKVSSSTSVSEGAHQ